MIGTGLLASAALGGAVGWAAPLAYLVLAEGAFAGQLDHAVDLADPATTRPGRGAVRGRGVRRRAAGHHSARRAGIVPRLTGSVAAHPGGRYAGFRRYLT